MPLVAVTITNPANLTPVVVGVPPIVQEPGGQPSIIE